MRTYILASENTRLGRQMPHGVTLLVERNVGCVINFDNGIVRAINICQVLARSISFVKPPNIAYTTISMARKERHDHKPSVKLSQDP